MIFNKKINNESIKIPEIITFYSPLSTGKTTLVKLLSKYISKNFKDKNIFILDIDFYSSCIKGENINSFDKVIELISENELKYAFKDNKFKKLNEKENIYIFSGLSNLLDVEFITREYLEDFIQSLRGNNSVIMIDCCRIISYDLTLFSLYASDKIIMPLIPSEFYINLFNKSLNFIINSLDIEREKIDVVINKYKENIHFSPKEIERIIGKEIKGLLNYRDYLEDDPYITELKGKDEKQLDLLFNSIFKDEQ